MENVRLYGAWGHPVISSHHDSCLGFHWDGDGGGSVPHWTRLLCCVVVEGQMTVHRHLRVETQMAATQRRMHSADTHTHTHTHAHSYTRRQTCTYARACAPHTHTRTHARTHTHSHVYTQTHTHTHTHTLPSLGRHASPLTPEAMPFQTDHTCFELHIA